MLGLVQKEKEKKQEEMQRWKQHQKQGSFGDLEDLGSHETHKRVEIHPVNTEKGRS